MKVLVTGACGFSARHLVPVLRSLGNEVVCVDIAGNAPGLIRLDCRDAESVGSMFDEVQPDRVYHLAGSFQNDYEIDYAINVVSTRTLFEAVLRAKRATRILIVGSAAEYGSVLTNPVAEEHPLRPRIIYGLTKLFQTELMRYYVAQTGIDVVMARAFNLYGEGVSKRLFIGKVYWEIERYKKGETTKIVLGNLQNRRDYLSVERAVADYQIIMERGSRGEVYNVGSGESIKILDLLNGILLENGIPLDAVEEGISPNQDRFDVQEIYADISKLRQLRAR